MEALIKFHIVIPAKERRPEMPESGAGVQKDQGTGHWRLLV